MAVRLLSDCFLCLGVVLPYAFQARIMLDTKDASGWNTHTSLMLITSAVLRCFFWYCKRFDDVLLIQALCSIATQLVMSWIVVLVGHRHGSAGSRGVLVRRHTFVYSLCGAGDGEHQGGAGLGARWVATLRGLWRWTDFQSYIFAVAALTAVVCVVTFVLGRSAAYAESLGALSLGIEALVPVPQAWQNQATKSTAGLSVVLILCWAAGDLFKSVLYVARAAPLQFLLCGLFQLAVDALLFLQLFVLFPAAADPRKSAAAAAGPEYRLLGSAPCSEDHRSSPPVSD